MAHLDFFNPHKIFVPHIVPSGIVNGKILPDTEDSSSADEKSEDEDEGKLGTEYAAKYQNIESNMYAESNNIKTGTLSCLDGIDEATGEYDDEVKRIKENAVGRVYNEYSFNVNLRTQPMPIDSYKRDILNMLSSSSVIIIHGPTGCGKTTQVPQIIIDDAKSRNAYCNVVVTQPRRIAAISVTKRVCHERGWRVGTVCGYQIALEKQVNQDTILTYVTTGVLLQKLINAKHLNEFTHIIIDEVHERTQEMDFILLLIRRYIYINSPNIKVILMSATFDTSKFAHYFRTYSLQHELPAPTLFVTKETLYNTSYYYIDQLAELQPIPNFEVEEPQLKSDLYHLLVKLILAFDKLDNIDHTTHKKYIGNVLVFLPGIYEIEQAYTLLNQAMQKDKSHIKWLILPLHSSITNNEQARVFVPPPEGVRKIILSTNIAESSITVSDIEYVIDFCLTKNQTVDPVTNYQSLRLEWASHVNCMQRSGRVGRVRDGRVYRLVPRSFYEKFLSTDIKPEILRAPLERLVLCTKQLDLFEPPKAILALAIDPPALRNIHLTILTLKEVGALLTTCRGEIMKNDGDLTFLGKIMSQIPIDVRLSKMICLGHIFSCLDQCIIMAAGCSLSNIFTSPFQEKIKSYTNKLIWADGSCSDLIAHLNLFRVWETNTRSGAFRRAKDERDWCQQHFLSLRSIKEWNILVNEIRDRLNDIGIIESGGPSHVVHSRTDLPLILKIVISGAFYPNYFKRSGDCGQIDEREAVKTLNGLNPMTTVYYSNMDASQPGPLYSKRIKELLTHCSNNTRIYFDSSSKVYVEFLDSQIPHTINLDGQQFVATIPGNISIDVHKAVRLRQVQNRSTIDVMSVKDSWKRAQQLGIVATNKLGKYNIIRKNRAEKTVMPSLIQQTIRIRVVHMVDAGHFYAHEENEETNRKLSILDDILNQNNYLTPLKGKPVVGEIYATKFIADKRYYRCRVMGLSPFQKSEFIVNIIFIDYGNTAVVHPESLYTIPPGKGKQFPALALECVLSEVQPSIVLNPRALWSQSANNTFNKTIIGKILNAMIYSVVNGVLSVELYQKGTTISFNKWLIQMGYAEEAEESFLSKENHLKRQQAQSYDTTNGFEVLDIEDNIFDNYVDDVEPPELHECHQRIILKGPFSPLEMNVYSVTDDVKTVHIDGNSVNSVLLDGNPQDPHERMLVATNISQSLSSTHLNLRHTTLMPNIHGLPVLLSLIFCPKMILKPTEDGTCFGAVLCGLGQNEQTKKPLYPAHDIVFTLDTVLDYADLTAINEIRYWMNMSIRSMEATYSRNRPNFEMDLCQREIRDRITHLLKRPRKSQERQYIKYANIWHKTLFDGEVMMPGDVLMDNEIWPLHNSMVLKEGNKEFSLVKRHIDDLHDMARNVKSMMEINCKLCNVKIYSVQEMRLHLSSDIHKKREMEYQ